MQKLSEVLENTLSLAPEQRNDLSSTPQHGLTGDAGRTSLAIQPRSRSLTERELTEIASQTLQTPFSITSEEKKIYGRKLITDEYGESFAENQFLGTEAGIDCIVDIKPNAPRNILQEALKASPKEACVKHLAHLTMHKKFGSTDTDRKIMLNDYVNGLAGYPEFVLHQVCKHYWQHDRRPFVPFIAEMKEACEIFTDALRYFLNRTTQPQAAEITKQSEEPWTPPTDAEKAKVSEMLAEFTKTIGAA